MGADIAVWLAALDGASDREAGRQSGAMRRSRISPGRAVEVARQALRLVLSAHTGIRPRDLSFERRCAVCGSRGHGKPRLVSPTRGRPPSFSLARSTHFAAIAVSQDQEIGVDLEDGNEAVPSTYSWCHPNEGRVLSTLPAGQAKVAALRLWVRREAVLKAMGVGLGDHGRGLDLSALPPRLTGWAYASQPWQLTDVDNPDGLVISLATARAAGVTVRRVAHQAYF